SSGGLTDMMQDAKGETQKENGAVLSFCVFSFCPFHSAPTDSPLTGPLDSEIGPAGKPSRRSGERSRRRSRSFAELPSRHPWRAADVAPQSPNQILSPNDDPAPGPIASLAPLP